MRYLVLFYAIFFGLTLFGQSKQDLENQRKRAAQEIDFTNKLIDETIKTKKDSYNKLLLIKSKIKQRQGLVKTIEKEIDYLNDNIEVHQEIIIGLENDLVLLKKEYEKIIYYSFLSNDKYNNLMFIIASESINEAYRRLKYYQQYTKFRKEQAKKIILTRETIEESIVELEILKADKKDRLLDKKIENNILVSEKDEKNKQVNYLAGKERELKITLQKQYDLSNRLKKEIERIIEEEARKAAERLKKSGGDFFQLTPEEQLIADIFGKNKSRLPWPTQRGVVTGEFGEHAHPVIKGVMIRNDGIDIATNEGAIVRSIYEGTVSRIFAIAGANKTIIIRHGNYLTVYSNLKDVTVKQGDKVSIKETIGVVFTEKENEHKSVLQFQIWKENEKLNPEDWLAKNKNG
ncbi:MAG: peptidoglycan DD-metalloendopeptidase family protein [Salinivirgaceae bacterium]|nr:peptidoglycan DD-metalloendopeptidase family protein [Salinivirgaceae bacterium]